MNRAFTSRDRQRQAGQVPSVLMLQMLKGVGMAVGLESVVGSCLPAAPARGVTAHGALAAVALVWPGQRSSRSEEHTSELQSHSDLVCRLLLEKKKKEQ